MKNVCFDETVRETHPKQCQKLCENEKLKNHYFENFISKFKSCSNTKSYKSCSLKGKIA